MFYYKLRAQAGDDATTKAWKKRCIDRLSALRGALREHIHGKEGSPRDEKRWLRLATWNIREFPSSKYGARLPESYYYIAEILSHFDIIAVQEVREDLTGLQKVMRILGPDWDFLATDVTEGSGGNRERMVFVYNKHKARFRNVAGELTLAGKDRINYPHEGRLSVAKGFQYVLPKGKGFGAKTAPTKKYRGKQRLVDDLVVPPPAGSTITSTKTSLVIPAKTEVQVDKKGNLVLSGAALEAALTKATIKLPGGAIVGDDLQFARTPYVVEFQSAWFKFILCTVHIYYGSDDVGMERRKSEIRQLTKFLAARAASEIDSDAESIFFVLGDFNIVDKKHETWKALHTNGFEVPEELREIPEGSNVDRSKAYDQIAYWTDPDERRAEHGSVSKVEVARADVFDFFETVFRMGDDDPDGVDESAYEPVMAQQQAHSAKASKKTNKKRAKKKSKKAAWKYKEWRTFQMSDHLPMWIELRTDFADEYLELIGKT